MGTIRLAVLGTTFFTMIMLGGCVTPEKAPPAAQAPARERPAPPPTTPEKGETPEQRYARDSERIAADPLAFLREVGQKTAQLRQYRLTLYRQERLGFPPQLTPLEEMNVAFRQHPFSVKIDWPDESAAYYESVYVQGENKGELLIRERKGALPFLPPMVRGIDPMLSVKIGKSKNPITDFGLERIMQRTLLPFDDPEIAKVTTIEYKGIVNLQPTNRPAHYIHIERPKTPGLAYTRQDIYFDAETLLPAGTDLYLPGNVLDARYRYADVNTDVHLTDADFRLSKGQPNSRPASGESGKDKG